MKLYLVRHGETDWNLAGKSQGLADVPLNNTGILQAKELKNKLGSSHFDICYCSPLKRAARTAEIAVGERVRIIFDDNLKERDFGDLEGTDSSTWTIDDYSRKINTTEGGIEPITDVLKRAEKVLERIRTENSTNASVIVIGHKVLLRALHFTIVGYDDDTDFRTFHLENGEIAKHEI